MLFFSKHTSILILITLILITFTFFIFIFFFQPSISLAESQYEYNFSNFELLDKEEDVLYLDDIEVTDLTFDQAAYIAGETISGEFTLVNNSQSEINNIFYEIQLVGNFYKELTEDSQQQTEIKEVTIPTTIFNEKRFIENKESPISLGVGENKKVLFSYQISKLIKSEDLGIQIQSYIGMNNGEEKISGKSSRTFAINGSITDYLEQIAQVQISGRPYGLASSPVIYKNGLNPNADKRLFFAISLKNNSKSTKTLFPKVEIYENLITGKLLDSFDAKEITVERGKTREQRIELPLFDYKNGNYTAFITYIDKDKDGGEEEGEVVISGPFEVRYYVEDTENILANIKSEEIGDDFSEVGKQKSQLSSVGIFGVVSVIFVVILLFLILALKFLPQSRLPQ